MCDVTVRENCIENLILGDFGPSGVKAFLFYMGQVLQCGIPWDLRFRPELAHYPNIVYAHSILYGWGPTVRQSCDLGFRPELVHYPNTHDIKNLCILTNTWSTKRVIITAVLNSLRLFWTKRVLILTFQPSFVASQFTCYVSIKFNYEIGCYYVTILPLYWLRYCDVIITSTLTS